MQRSELSTAQITYLDFVRAAAALMVLFGHAAIYFLPESWLVPTKLQSFGVFIFFLISGFLISLSVLQKLDSPNYGFGDYFIDRAARIYSAFLPTLIFVAVLDAFVVAEPAFQWRRDYNLQTWIGNLFMLQEYPVFQVLRRLGAPDSQWFIGPFGSAQPFWTISIEWWIYMLFGGVMFFCVRRGSEVKPFTILLLLFAGIEPFYHFIGGYASCLTMMWMLGMGAAILFHRLPALRVRMPFLTERRIYVLGLAAVPVGILLMAGRLFANRYHIYELQLGLFLGLTIFGLLFALGQVRIAANGVLARLCGGLAAYSYSLYLTHHSILEFFHARHPEWVGSTTVFWSLILLSNVVAIAFWWAFERHHRQLARWARSHLPRGRVRGVPLATSS